MKINGHEIKPFANLKGANLKGANLKGAILEGANLEYANLEGANLKDTILDKIPQDDKDTKIQELEDELKKYKDTLKALLDT